MIWKLTSAACLVVFCVAFAWPWLDSALTRRNVPQRLLDRLEEEWDREGEAPPAEPWNW